MPYRSFLFALAVYLLALFGFVHFGWGQPANAAVPRRVHSQKFFKKSARVARYEAAKRRARLQKHRLALHHRWDRNINAHPNQGAYSRYYRVTATAYAPINRGMEGGRWTRTQRDGRTAHGVAVDPHLIPLGTRLWIPGYGHAVADDTGGRIRGRHIDLRMQHWANVNQWGRRPVRVYVLSAPAG